MSVVNPLQKSQGKKNKSQINKKKKTKKVSKKRKKDPGHEYEGKQLSQNVHYKPINLSTILAFRFDIHKGSNVKSVKNETKKIIKQEMNTYFNKVYGSSVKNVTEFKEKNPIASSWFEVLTDDYIELTETQEIENMSEIKGRFCLAIHLFHFEYIQTKETTNFIFELIRSKIKDAKVGDYTIYPVVDKCVSGMSKRVFSKHLTKQVIKEGVAKKEGYERFRKGFPFSKGAFLYNIDMQPLEMNNGTLKLPKKNAEWEVQDKNIHMIPMHFKTKDYKYLDHVLKYEYCESSVKYEPHYAPKDIAEIPNYMFSFRKNNEWKETREKLIKPKLSNRIDTIHPGRIRKQEDKKAMFNEKFMPTDDDDDDDGGDFIEYEMMLYDNSHADGTLYYHDTGHDKELLYKDKFEKSIIVLRPEEMNQMDEIWTKKKTTRLPQHTFAKRDGNDTGEIYRAVGWLEEGLMSMNCGEEAIFKYEAMTDASITGASKDSPMNKNEQYVLVKLNKVEYDIEGVEYGNFTCCLTSMGDQLDAAGELQEYFRCNSSCKKNDSICIGGAKCIRTMCRCSMASAGLCVFAVASQTATD